MSTSTTPVAVDIPEEAKAHTPEGGIAFVKFVVMEGSRALSSNEPAGFLSLTLPDCRGCQAIAAAIKDQLAADSWSPTPRATVTGAQLAAPESPQGLQIDVQGVEVAATLVNAKGVVVGQSPEIPLRLRFAIAWTEDGWKVADVVTIK